jgi:NAD-dependent DNA ligase
LIPQVLSSREDLFRISLHSSLSLREMKERTKRFYNNINAKKLKSIEELVTAIATTHNIIRAGGEEVIPT